MEVKRNKKKSRKYFLRFRLENLPHLISRRHSMKRERSPEVLKFPFLITTSTFHPPLKKRKARESPKILIRKTPTASPPRSQNMSMRQRRSLITRMSHLPLRYRWNVKPPPSWSLRRW